MVLSVVQVAVWWVWFLRILSNGLSWVADVATFMVQTRGNV